MSATTAPSETLQLTLTLPAVVTEYIRQKVAGGLYASEGEYIESILLSDALFEPRSEEDSVRWMNTEGVRRLKALEADPSSALTIDQAFAGLIDEEDV